MPVVTLTHTDINDVLDIQREAYVPALLESADTFIAKMRAFPSGALGYRQDHCLWGYVFCHPWKQGEPVPLDLRQFVLPTSPDCFYIHDLAVRPSCQGRQIASHLLKALKNLAVATNLHRFALISVQNSEGFWMKHGFTQVKQISYAEGVIGTYMVRKDPEL